MLIKNLIENEEEIRQRLERIFLMENMSYERFGIKVGNIAGQVIYRFLMKNGKVRAGTLYCFRQFCNRYERQERNFSYIDKDDESAD